MQVVPNNRMVRQGSYIVFEKASGKIVSILHVDVMEGAVAPPPSEIAHEAIRSTSRQTGKNIASLHVLKVRPEDIKPDIRYIVDVEARELREITPERRLLQFRGR